LKLGAKGKMQGKVRVSPTPCREVGKLRAAKIPDPGPFFNPEIADYERPNPGISGLENKVFMH